MIMRNFLNLSLAGLALAGAAVPAEASPAKANNHKAREALGTLGRCLVGIRADDIRAYLRSPSRSTWHPITYYRNDEAPCVGLYTVETGTAAMRGAVAEAWYLANFAGAAPAAFSSAERNVAPPQTETAALITAASEEDRPQVVVDEFARCVAAVAPMGVDVLLRTPVASAAEGRAIGALSPQFGPCAFEGQKLAFNAEMLRAALAFALASRVVRETVA